MTINDVRVRNSNWRGQSYVSLSTRSTWSTGPTKKDPVVGFVLLTDSDGVRGSKRKKKPPKKKLLGLVFLFCDVILTRSFISKILFIG